MKLNRNILAIVLSTLLIGIVFPGIVVTSAFAQTQDAGGAIRPGYRAGYSDGFMAGSKDIIDSSSKDYSRHSDYTAADRAYNKKYGPLEDYRDGYQQGFESGYDTGFEKRPYDTTLPANLGKRVAAVDPTDTASATIVDSTETAAPQTKDTETADTETEDTKADSSENTGATDAPASIQTNANASIVIPRDTELIVELQDDLSTVDSREGTPFTAKVSSPSEIAGATIEGRVRQVGKPSRLKGHSEISLSFDRIILSDNRWSNFNAILTEVMPVKGDNVRSVDNEGTAIGQNSYKQNAIKIGAPAGAGMIIGGIVGGPVGVAVGAGVGAAFGFGTVMVKGGKHIRLNKNQQLRVKTGYETQIR